MVRTRPKMMERFVVTTWIVWNRRNKTHLNQSVQPLAQVLDEANLSSRIQEIQCLPNEN